MSRTTLRWLSRALVTTLVAAAIGFSASHSRIEKTHAATPPLPTDRLQFGVANDPSGLGWMSSSGVPWRYRYAYLAGGVNTSNPWPNWNSPTGAYATNYMNNSSGSGYIPVFSYYNLLQSLPSSGASESDRDFNNLNNPATMNTYYADFKLLMQLAGSFGKPVVVQVEPDFWGYMQQRGAGGDASTVSASVASSGFAEAAGLPNTVQGFAYELLKLRDLYGANAILAIHASLWASGIDIGSDTNPAVNATTVADSTAAFLNSAGIASNPFGSTWDLVFNDVDDHDAGWWEQQGADNAFFTHWWDPANTKFPNFTRYLAWVAEMKLKTARPQIVWQVPVGNQYFLTMNNTCGHYQDNVAPYFISHPSDLFSAGLIAVLFGAGNGCQTTYDDGNTDGITNNGGAPTTDALGGCVACNSHTSVWPDDDGGYLRIFVGQYYCAAIGQRALLADFSGDGKADLALIGSAGACVVPSTGSAFASPWSPSAPFYGSRATLAGDLNGDGKADLVAVNDHDAWVLTSSGSALSAPSQWSNIQFHGSRGTFLADVTGDGKADLVAVNDSSVWVMTSTGSGFAAPVLWSSTPFYGSVATMIADVTGDGKPDLVAVSAGSTWVMASTGSGFAGPVQWSNQPFYGSRATLAASVSGSGRADLVAVNGGDIWVMSSTGSAFGPPSRWSSTPFYGSVATLGADVNGDGKADLVAVNSPGVWVEVSNGGGFAAPAGWQ